MNRIVRRVPLNFDHPPGPERWGICAACVGDSSVEAYPGQRADAEAWTWSHPPEGEGWQLWETVAEGSPISPVFPTAQELARWLTTREGATAINQEPMTYEEALKFVLLLLWTPAPPG